MNEEDYEEQLRKEEEEERKRKEKEEALKDWLKEKLRKEQEKPPRYTESQARKTAIDRVNRTIQRGKSTYARMRGAARGARSLAQGLRGAGTAARGAAVAAEAAAATSEIWVPILLILIGIIAIWVFFTDIGIMSIITGSSETQKTPPRGSSVGALPSGVPTPTPWTRVCPLGTRDCDYNSLLNFGYFRDPTLDKATKASMVCQDQSASNPTLINSGCLRGQGGGYKVGLFQIDVLYYCSGALSGNSTTCTVSNQETLDVCISQFIDPVENIKKAVLISKDGTDWSYWSNTVLACNIGNPTPVPTGILPTPPPPSTGSLDYYIPFRDSAVRPIPLSDIQAQILSIWPNAQLQNWDTIVSRSIANDWNPAFLLTLWIEETGAQGKIPYDDPLGCDPSHPTTDINISLLCVFNSFVSFTNDRFEDFMCTYGGDGFHNAPCTFLVANPNFPGNVKTWYSRLVPAGTYGALVPTTPTSALADKIKNQFGITMNGFGDTQLQWAYEKFYTLYQRTKIGNYISGVTIIPTSGGSYTQDKDTIYLKVYTVQQTFNVIMLHELGHVIQLRTRLFVTELTNAISQEYYLTTYSANADADSGLPSTDPNYGQCDGFKFNEDYAETIAYYLNPAAQSLTSNFTHCKSDGSYPVISSTVHPLHYQIAQSILGPYP